MQLYDFEVLNGDEIIAAEPAVPLCDTRAAWPKIAKIAKKITLPGCRIRVREQSGDTIILIGATAAASWRATRTTFAGSTMPALSMSTYCSVWASKP